MRYYWCWNLRYLIDRLRPDCGDCFRNIRGPFWIRGKWIFGKHVLDEDKRCPLCKRVLGKPEEINVVLLEEREYQTRGFSIKFLGIFLDLLDKRTVQYKKRKGILIK